MLEIEKVKSKKVIISLLAAGACLGVLQSFLPSFIVSLLISIFLLITLAHSWNLITGYGGQVMFGAFGIFGTGAYLSVLIYQWTSLLPILSVFVGSIITTLVWAAILYPCFSLRSHYFAIATLILGMAALLIAVALPEITAGSMGLLVGTSFTLYTTYWLQLSVAIIATGVVYYISNSRFGLELQAIREDEDAAGAIGIKAHILKLKLFLIAGFFMAIIGAIHGFYLGMMFPYSIFDMMTYNNMAIFATVLGGMGTAFGPIVGAISLQTIQWWGAMEYPAASTMIFTGLMLIVLRFSRGGMGRMIEKVVETARGF